MDLPHPVPSPSRRGVVGDRSEGKSPLEGSKTDLLYKTIPPQVPTASCGVPHRLRWVETAPANEGQGQEIDECTEEEQPAMDDPDFGI
jgi:hypothetical protein